MLPAHSRQIINPAEKRGCLLRLISLDGSFDLAGSHASCADFCSSDCTVVHDTYRLDIRIPLSLAVSVGMADLVAGHLSLSADFTLSGHLLHLPLIDVYFNEFYSFHTEQMEL